MITDCLLITARELATRCNVSLRTVENWRYRKQGPTYVKLLNGRIRYPMPGVNVFIAQYTGHPDEGAA